LPQLENIHYYYYTSVVMLAAIIITACAVGVWGQGLRGDPRPGTFPPMDITTAFRLVANVTNLSKDLDPPVHNMYLYPDRATPPTNRASLAAGADRWIFWLNGTGSELRAGPGAKLLTDSGMQYAYGLNMGFDQDFAEKHTRELYINIEDQAGRGWNVGLGPNAMPHIYPPEPPFHNGTFMACEVEGLRTDGGKAVVVNYVYTDVREVREWSKFVPDKCTPISIMAECAEMPKLLEVAEYNHDNALSVPCYKNVSEIDWPKFSWITVWWPGFVVEPDKLAPLDP
jgi:hypothetical protein